MLFPGYRAAASHFSDVGNGNKSRDCSQPIMHSTQEPSALETMSRADVGDVVDYGLAAGTPVRTLLSAMAEAGCPVDRRFFHVMRCSAAVGGGFAPDHGVILCHNRLHTRREVLNAMAHELIHAYDHCRHGGGGGAASVVASGGGAAVASGGGTAVAASPAGGSGASAAAISPPGSSGGAGGLDWSNCRHHAYTEVRAANLSGDCSLGQELMRGNLPLLPHRWADQQRDCVARRAALSVAMNPACGGPEAAAAVVSEMMPVGLADVAPFEASEGVARP